MGGNPLDYLGVADATTTTKGKVELATTAETTTGTSTTLVCTPAGVAAVAIAGSPDASTSTKGITEYATDAEAVAKTATNKAIVASNLDNILAAPGAIGGTTAAAGTFTTLDTSGAVTMVGGVLNLGSDNAANAVNLGVGTTARAIGIGDSAAAHTITVGSATGAASLDLLAGTGNFSLDGAATTDYAMGATTTSGSMTIGGTAQTGDLVVGTSSGTMNLNLGIGTGATTVNMASGGTGANTVNIATGAIGNIVTMGSVTAASQLDLKCGTGNFTLEGNVASTYDLSETGVNTGTFSLGGGTGARTVNLAVGGTGAKTVNIATSAIGNIVTIGTVTAAASLDLKCGTGNFTLEGDTTSTYDLSSTGVNTGTVTLASGTGARTVELAGGGTGIKTVNIATGATADVVTIGTATGAGSLDLKCGTGDFTLEGDVAATYEISSTGINTGTCKFASGTGARTVEMAGGGTGIKTVNIAAAATADVVTIGDSTGAGSLALVCGTGNMTLEGATASTYAISSTGVNTGTVTLASGTGARTVEIAGGGTGIKTINIGAAATADVITIGTTTAAGSLTLAAGTGDITFSGTVKEINAEYLFASGTDLTVTQSPICQTALTTGVAPTGTAGDVNLMMMQDGCQMEQFIIGTQTIIAPRMSANGLNLAGDAVNTDGNEYNFGARANAKHAYTIGTSAAFEFEAKLYPTAMAGVLHGGIGFRKVEANNATLASYTDYVFIGMVAASSGTVVYILDELNSGGQTATSTTDNWGGDATAQTLKILVSAAGVVTFEVGGSAASAAPSFTFDNADVVMPFYRVEQNATTTAEFSLQTQKIGFQA